MSCRAKLNIRALRSKNRQRELSWMLAVFVVVDGYFIFVKPVKSSFQSFRSSAQ